MNARHTGAVPPDARKRLLHGLEQAIEEKRGYRDTTMTDIVRVARASRRTFYRVFETKDHVLLALMEEVNDDLVQDVARGVDPRAGWREQVAQAIGVYFDHIRRRPAVHLCSIRELPYLGELAAPMIRRINDAFVALIYQLTDNDEFRRGGLAPAPRHLAMMVLGAINELIADILASGDDIDDGLDLAIAGTTALLATNFDARDTDGSRSGSRARAGSG